MHIHCARKKNLDCFAIPGVFASLRCWVSAHSRPTPRPSRASWPLLGRGRCRRRRATKSARTRCRPRSMGIKFLRETMQPSFRRDREEAYQKFAPKVRALATLHRPRSKRCGRTPSARWRCCVRRAGPSPPVPSLVEGGRGARGQGSARFAAARGGFEG